MTYDIAYVGMTHLGIISAVAASEKGYRVACYDPNSDLIDALINLQPPISEPELIPLMIKNQEKLFFSSDPKILQASPLIYVSPDVATDSVGKSDLTAINFLLEITLKNTTKDKIVVILSQVPPGFSRSKSDPTRVLYYQVETLIFGQAINRALFPERFIVGCPSSFDVLPSVYSSFLELFECPILKMSYESAELAKISINMFLVASVTTTNVLAELSEKVGADWSEIAPALRLDKRIGQFAYLNPGLGISGGNLERDLCTVARYAKGCKTDFEVVETWLKNSERRKNWIWDTFHRIGLSDLSSGKIGILGLTYKEGTHSLKNSPALLFLSKVPKFNVVAYDPMADKSAIPSFVKTVNSAVEALNGVDVLILSTAWPEFRGISGQMLLENMLGRVVIDPFGLLNGDFLIANGFSYFALGK